MISQDKLSKMISAHWQKYQPTIYAELQQDGMLEAMIAQETERYSEMLYSLTVEKKMDYSKAGEIVINELLPPDEEESSSTSQSQNPGHPATSE